MNKNELSSDFLVDTTQKENVYLLGFLWADGWVINKGYTHRVSMSIVKDDFVMIEPLLQKYGVKSFNERQRIVNGKVFGRISKSFQINSKSIVNFLLDNDYDKKSGCDPTKILSIIPEKLQHHFWRGYLDGDGCIFIKKRCELAFWSVINQDWSSAISLFSNLKIPYQIYTYSRKNGKHQSSVFRTGCVDDIVKFCEYIYKDYDNMGLRRKYEKYLLLKEKQRTMHRKTSKYVGICFCSRAKKWTARYYNKITKNDKHLGWFPSEVLAVEALEKYKTTLTV